MNIWDSLIITPFINVLLFIYNLIGQNFGIAIILFTLLIRLVTHPLMVKQIKGAQGMQDLQKNEKWIKAQEKYKGDKEKLAQEQMALYKELGINPFASCLPTLIQLPIIFGLYQAEQALHELDEHRILKLALKHHERECAAIGDRGDHVAPEALPGGAYHGRPAQGG